ncbi:hypothetical protein GCM10009801_59420 [Streptomyces albiaxialis]|uniref:YcaO domain-containing protein n=1 Tax=Streptomyces albiaxialis TaxID=329523 RepID=A0ABN2WHN0_9ACTN
MRPRLRDHVRFLERPDGTYVHAPHGGTLLPGAHLHAWLDRLAPFLTGEHSLAELVEALPPEQRETVERLVGTLAEGGFVTDAVPERPHGLSADEQRLYAEQLAFLRYAADSAEHRFERLRAARVALWGDGPLLAEVLRLGLRSGWRTVEVTVPDGAPAEPLRRLAATARKDALQEVTVRRAPGTAPMPPYELRVRLADDEQPPEEGALCRVAAGSEAVWIGPVGGPSPPAELGTHPLETLDPAARAVVAAQVVLVCLRHLTGLEGEDGRPSRAVRVDPQALTTSEHVVTHRDPGPVRPRAGRTAREVAAWWDAPGLSREELDRRAARLTDARTGVLRAVGPGAWAQHPWWTCRAEVRVPRGGTLAVGGYGRTREEARERAVLTALAARATRLEEAAPGTGRPAHGRELCTGAPIEIPGPADGDGGGNGDGDRDRDGALAVTAGGLSVPEAAFHGVRALAERLLVARLSGWRTPFPEVGGAGAEPHTEAYALLRATGLEVRVHDLSAVLGGLPAFAVTLDGATVALRCGARRDEARAEALGLALLAWQSATAGEPEYAPPVAGALPEDLRGPRDRARPGHVPPGLVPPEPERTPPEQERVPSGGARRGPGLVAALAAAGARPVALPVCADPVVTAAVPSLVRVVLVEGSPE